MNQTKTVDNNPAIDAIGMGFQWMLTVLFRPFNFTKWFLLALAVFMIGLVQQGSQAPRIVVRGLRQENNWPQFLQDCQHMLREWIGLHTAWAIAIGVSVVLISIAVWLALLLLSCYGTCIFTAGVARNRVDFGQLWREVGAASLRLFAFRAILTVGLVVCIAVVVIPAGLLAAATQAPMFVKGSLIAVAAVGVVLLALVYALVGLLLNDVIVPVILKFDLSMIGAWAFLWEMARIRAPQFLLYILLKSLLATGSAMLVFALVLLTCCVAALPILNQLATLPVTVFFRAYSLRFLECIHPDLKLIQDGPDA